MPPPSEITFRLRKNPFSPFAGRDKRAGERFRRLGAAVDQDGAGRRWGALRVCSGAPGRRRSRLEFLCTVEPVFLPNPDLEEAGGRGLGAAAAAPRSLETPPVAPTDQRTRSTLPLSLALRRTKRSPPRGASCCNCRLGTPPPCSIQAAEGRAVGIRAQAGGVRED